MNSQLAKIYGACNPDNPAKQEYYQDCSEARGGNVFVEQIKDHIVLANASMDEFSIDASDYKCFLFTGHSGCGKSSELRRLVRELQTYSEDTRFYPIFIDANEYLDRFDVTITDILLAIATETADVLQRDENLKIKGSHFDHFKGKLKTVFTELQIEEIEIDLPYLPKTGIKRLAKDDSARKLVREALKDDTYLLLREINKLLNVARDKVRNLEAHSGQTQKYQDVVIILDNLEKIERFGEAEMGLESARKLFLQYSTQLTAIESHIIYTVPIDLMRSNDASVIGKLYDKSFVLPMVKVFQRDGVTPFPVGIETMTEILKKRLGGIEREQAFTDEALDLLINYSGGHIRTFLLFAREACTDADGLPITADSVNYAINSEYQNISPSFFPPHTWETLAALDLSSSQEIPVEPKDCVEVLEKLLLFEYINGDDKTTGNHGNNRNLQTPWYAVNPIYRELNQFKAAKDRLKNPPQEEVEIE